MKRSRKRSGSPTSSSMTSVQSGASPGHSALRFSNFPPARPVITVCSASASTGPAVDPNTSRTSCPTAERKAGKAATSRSAGGR
jgi:hypothetical protein